ncbi:zinc ribbon domain-containing protein [Methanimicrococcus blatticola]|uniref:Zinc ribbon protein n=1 Tax=Methanimicrococcus blatticola TaxID=91560 RepID=A0A484F5M7_9EURY|nr:zinc ribbon domain-containing protein [Methanimicrococcus blatticola]MBZ3935831.1 zinc-ribbon domain-containing protein [Methanimicrococcus blatticola]MCC2508049.1 DUF5683 domain-containing protein [Methanimicrococcus blatticola]TDQ68869.1 zinc ribbon protein [Methanimicrococcus blatticola]
MAANYCSNCGEPLKEYAIVCSNCGKPIPGRSEVHETGREETRKESGTHSEEKVHAEHVYTNSKQRNVDQSKNTFFALILSFFIPGLGQVYNGRFWKGVGFMIAVPLGTLLLLIPGIIIWAWGMYDAYTESDRINKGELPYKEPTVWEIIGFLLLPILVGLLFVLLSFIFFMIIAIPLALI